ncbi:hypothetical protein LSTR_LSTR014169 [Laodelphax striatellus]|uniref:Uncharacterized protein n=1 Tax=Laodelphax striatellus TaxID=195883 RepID=A0A482X3A2_LAOST|nr:hypothetical protein LSTR_LSTR014169 [Laodelphax striatellus]
MTIDINIVELASNHSRPGDELPNKCEAIISVWLSAEGRNEAALTSLHFSAPHSVVVSNSASTCFLSALRFARCRNHQTPIETVSVFEGSPTKTHTTTTVRSPITYLLKDLSGERKFFLSHTLGRMGDKIADFDCQGDVKTFIPPCCQVRCSEVSSLSRNSGGEPERLDIDVSFQNKNLGGFKQKTQRIANAD